MGGGRVIDVYARHAVASLGAWALYLDGSQSALQKARRRRLVTHTRARGQRLLVSEGQAEPWETVTTPPNPAGGAMSSCPVERVIENYNDCIRWTQQTVPRLYAYIFWGAEYWLLRESSGDPRYMQAFGRILEESG